MAQGVIETYNFVVQGISETSSFMTQDIAKTSKFHGTRPQDQLQHPASVSFMAQDHKTSCNIQLQ
jgi:hypothetical protein